MEAAHIQHLCLQDTEGQQNFYFSNVPMRLAEGTAEPRLISPGAPRTGLESLQLESLRKSHQGHTVCQMKEPPSSPLTSLQEARKQKQDMRHSANLSDSL